MINVIEMFCDLSFFKVFCIKVILVLKDYSEICIWYVGCVMGEEVFFMVIFLEEEGLMDKMVIYVIDMNEDVLEKVK